VVCCKLALLGGLVGGMLLGVLLLHLLLLIVVLYSLTPAANSPYDCTHRSPSGGAFAGIAGDCPPTAPSAAPPPAPLKMWRRDG
jgi:hypothetical protein